MPGFPRALARTLEELALATVSPRALRALPDVGGDLADLFERFDAQFQSASAVDRAAFLRTATRGGRRSRRTRRSVRGVPPAAPRRRRSRTPPSARSSRRWSRARPTRSPRCPQATLRHVDALVGARRDRCRSIATEPAGSTACAAICSPPSAPPPAEPLDEVELFSAPGEGRESVEIARRVLREARRGVPFDRMAIALRAPQHYAGLLEHALERAGVPVYFERGTRRPHPAGRAFLALIACALDNLSARRFAEYLSLGQVPDRRRRPARRRVSDVERRSVRRAGRARRAAAQREQADEDTSEAERTDTPAPTRVPRAVEMGAPARRVARRHRRATGGRAA